ncbi:MAG TPA: methylated-DNA--[protein]-cysteine S-methyltransferase [Candidatus Sulfobium mesophilum]|nr:methylated-DNA--[protein]-cysteine S-methyltransferase [Candidatus Sulfobium mesophilum]
MKQKRSENIGYYDILDTPLGMLYLVFNSSFLTGVAFQRPAGILLKKTEETAFVKKELTEYFGKGRRDFTCRTAFTEGTDFEKLVWDTLREIPYAETRTYKWMAEKVGHPHAFRAVGNALGKNPIPIIFPCHRVIESDGSLGGYSSGEEIKRRLLEFEYYTRLSGS